MSPADAARLLLLSSLWGFSFIFMRVAVPEFGPVSLIGLRMGLGALLLLPLLASRQQLALLRANAGPLVVLGLTTTALPYSLLALATVGLEAGFTSLINAATPIATALIGMAFFATPVLREQIIGLTLALAALSTAGALLLYFRLLSSAGATATSTVTMLVPVSALAWGMLLLGETLTLQMLAGMVATLLGTAIATGVLQLRRRRTLSP